MTESVLYRTLKRVIERGNLEGIETKLDVFMAADRLSLDEYSSLMSQVNTKREELYDDY